MPLTLSPACGDKLMNCDNAPSENAATTAKATVKSIGVKPCSARHHCAASRTKAASTTPAASDSCCATV